MTTRMLRCPSCRTYTFRAACPQCSTRTASPLPPRYSPEDRYGEYRRRLRELVSEEAAASSSHGARPRRLPEEATASSSRGARPRRVPEEGS